MGNPSKVFILAGEHSGDVCGGKLLTAMRKLSPGIHAYGVGGPEMRQQGLECVMPMEDFQVMGFVDIVRRFPAIWKQFYAIRDLILKTQPDVAIFIDYPGFNLRLAKSLRKKGYKGKLVHYVCPTVWVWGKGRIKTLADNLDLLLTIFPFEPPLFSDTKLDTRFVGHPLIEALNHHHYDPQWAEKVGITNTDNILALFPGSRTGEITRLLRRQLEAAIRLRNKEPSLQIALSCADEKQLPLIREIACKCGLELGKDFYLVPREHTYDLMKACRTAIAKSGTVNLELALHGKPCVVVYEVSIINYLILWYFIRLHLDHYSIVNILCNRTVYPELIAEPFTSEELFQTLLPLHIDGPDRNACLEGCREVQEGLAGATKSLVASQGAAEAITTLCRV